MVHAVIMAGGGGTRFWPRSRAANPKQFLKLAGDRSLLQQACDRLEAKIPAKNLWVITADMHADQVRSQLPQLPSNNVVGEPMGRDTAACIGLGAALIANHDPDAVMVVTPADHVIEPERSFHQGLQAAIQLADEIPDALITFGINPTFPATGYGYINRGKLFAERLGVPVYHVESFREKPNRDVAEEYIASGNYYWNSGIFVWKVKTILGELEKNQPKLFSAIQSIAAKWGSPEQDQVFQEEYAKLQKVSIDFAVMEKATKVLVLQAPFLWDDVGSWLALERMNAQDAHGNTVIGGHCGVRTNHCIVVGDPDMLIGTVGIDNLIIIQDGDAVLVAHKNEEGNIKQLVEKLRESGREKYL